MPSPNTPHITITSGKNLPEIVDADFHVAFYKDGMFLGGSEGTHFNIPQGSNQMKISISSNTQVTCLGARFENPIVHKDDDEVRFAESERQKSKNLFDINNYTTKVVGGLGFDISNLEMGKTYTFSTSSPIGWFKISDGSTGYNSVAADSQSNDLYQFTFTMTRNINISDTATQYLFLGTGNFELYSLDNVLTRNIQIEEGTVATAWQPYNGAVAHKADIDGLKGKVLWTNPNPKSSFSSQTISLASSYYDTLLCYVSLYAESSKNPRIFSVECEKGNNIVLNIAADYSGKYGTFYRECTYVSDTQLTITGGSYQTSSGLGTDNSICVPVKIIGYRRG
jgi:hypothetical protein